MSNDTEAFVFEYREMVIGMNLQDERNTLEKPISLAGE